MDKQINKGVGLTCFIYDREKGLNVFAQMRSINDFLFQKKTSLGSIYKKEKSFRTEGSREPAEALITNIAHF